MRAAFTPDQLQFIGMVVVTFGSAFMGLLWKVAIWKSRVDDDLDNLGAIIGTAKGKSRLEKRKNKPAWYILRRKYKQGEENGNCTGISKEHVDKP